MRTTQRLVGVALIVVSAVSFGTLAIFGRYAYADGIDVPTLLFMRFTMASLVMAALLFIAREPLPRGRTLGLLIGMGAIGYVGQSFCYLSAVKYASAGLAALLLYLYPVFVVILSLVFRKEKVTRSRMCALGLATLGVALTANPQGGSRTGVLLAISAAAIYAVYILVGAGVMQRVSAAPSSMVIFASAGTVYGVFTAASGPHWPASRAGWMAVAGMALLSTVIPVVTFLAGLKRVGPTEASMLSTLEPVVTVVLAAWLFKERLSPLTLAGGALILAAVVLLARGELQPPRSASQAMT